MPGVKRTYSATLTPLKPTKRRYKRAGGLVRYRRQPMLGKKVRTSLKYTEVVNLAHGAVNGLPGVYVFSANGMYDPNNSGLGHQPRGFDQLNAMYDHYTVLGATITVRFTNQSTSGRDYCFIHTRDRDSTVSDYRDIFEDRESVISYKPVLRLSTADEAGEAMSTSLTHSTNISKFLGRSSIMSDPQCKGSGGANPTEQVYFHVGIVNPLDASVGSVDAVVTIEYDAVFHEPKLPGLS